MNSILFRDAMVPIIEEDSILLLGYSILCQEYNLTGFNHQKNSTQMMPLMRGILHHPHPWCRFCKLSFSV